MPLGPGFWLVAVPQTLLVQLTGRGWTTGRVCVEDFCPSLAGSSWVLDKPLWTVTPFTGEEKAVLPLRIKGSSWELGAGAATTE